MAAFVPPDELFMFANHSSIPNCLWHIESVGGYLTANERIKQGEEITYDYNLEKAPDFIKKQAPAWMHPDYINP